MVNKLATSLIAALMWCNLAKASDADPDFVVLVNGSSADVEALSVVQSEISGRLRAKNYALLPEPARAFEALHSRPARPVDDGELDRLTEQVDKALLVRTGPNSWGPNVAAIDGERLNRVVDLALELVAKLEASPETPVIGDKGQGAALRAVTRACYDGIYAAHKLARQPAERQLFDFCTSLPWLMQADGQKLRPDVRQLFASRELVTVDLRFSIEPANVPVRLGGASLASPHRIRVRPGARLAIVPECGSTARAHWFTAIPGADRTEVHIDCALDAALHTDDRGLWLSSTADQAEVYARAIARVLGARRIVVVAKRTDAYSLRLLPSNDAPGATVALAHLHSDRQLQAAVDQLLAEDARADGILAPRSSAGPSAIDGSTRWSLWSGVAALSVGAAGTAIAGWLYSERRRDLEQRQQGLVVDEISPKDLWGNSRAQMLGAVLGSAVFTSAGAALVTASVGSERPSWWVAGGIAAAGAGFATWGAVDMVKGERCGDDQDPFDCGAQQIRFDRGVLLLGVAAPLLTVPLTKVVASETKHLRKTRVDVGVTAAGLHVRGIW